MMSDQNIQTKRRVLITGLKAHYITFGKHTSHLLGVCVCVSETKATKGQSANSSLWSVTITDTAVIQTVTPADGHFTRC